MSETLRAFMGVMFAVNTCWVYLIWEKLDSPPPGKPLTMVLMVFFELVSNILVKIW